MKKYFVALLSAFLVSGIFRAPVAQANSIEDTFIEAGLVDISTVDPTIKVDLVNSDPQKNFFREDYYQGLNKAYLRKKVALKLCQAQKILKQKYPDYSLKILDAARPRSVSRKMYDKMKGTKFQRYVASPAKGSMHNYGIAVDITVVDSRGKELDMGISPFNQSTMQIYWQYFLMKIGKETSQEQKANRKLLARVMLQAGFYPLAHEWWHFNGMKKEEARQLIKIIE